MINLWYKAVKLKKVGSEFKRSNQGQSEGLKKPILSTEVMVGSIFMQSRHTKFKLGYRSDWDQPRCQWFIVQLDLTCKLEATLRVNMYVKVVLLFKSRTEVT